MEDLGFFADLNADADVMVHVSGRPSTRAETEAEWGRRFGERSSIEEGLGYWIGLVEGQAVGWWGLGTAASAPGSGELGLRLQRAHWRRGLGTEGARTLVTHAFTALDVARVWAGTSTANAASRRTLARAGLRAPPNRSQAS